MGDQCLKFYDGIVSLLLVTELHDQLHTAWHHAAKGIYQNGVHAACWKNVLSSGAVDE